MKKKYIPEPGAIVEMVCCLAAILLLFTSWLQGYADGKVLNHIPTTAEMLKDIFGKDMTFVKVVIVLFFVNIIVKFFDRTAWLSAICAFIFGYILLFVHKGMIEANQSPVMIWSDSRVNLSGMGLIATFVELTLVVELFVRFVTWLTELFKKRGGMPFVVSMLAWAIMFIALICIFFVWLGNRGRCEGDTAYEGLMILAMVSSVAFLIFDIVGIVKWFQLKKQDKASALAATDVETTVPDEEDQEVAEGEKKQEQGKITLRQILLFVTTAVIFAPMPFIIDTAMKEDQESPAIVDTIEPEAELGTDSESTIEEESAAEPYASSEFDEEETVDEPSNEISADSYVTITGVNVRLRTTPEINDNNIIKDDRGKNVHPNKGESLKCVGEEGDFYLVLYRGDFVYVSKKYAVLK